MNFELSIHSQQELEARQIPVLVVGTILDSPEQMVEEDGLQDYHGRFVAANGKTYLLRVFVNDNLDPPKVVTVYQTSKIKKYWR